MNNQQIILDCLVTATLSVFTLAVTMGALLNYVLGN